MIEELISGDAAFTLVVLVVIIICLIGVWLSTAPDRYEETSTARELYDTHGDTDNVTLTFTITVRKRWIPQLIGMFRTMQALGNMGSSRTIGFYADGDGDFRPKFEVEGVPLWDKEKSAPSEWGEVAADHIETERPLQLDFFYDAG